MLRALIIAFVLIGISTVVYVAVSATGSQSYSHKLQKHAVGELADLDFSTAGEPVAAATFLGPNGNATDLSRFAGKTILVNFWATWCGPCEKELPSLGALQRARGGDNFEVVLISVDSLSDSDYAAKRMTELAGPGLTFYQAAPEDQYEVVYGSGVSVFPTTILYGPDGLEIARYVGDTDWSSLAAIGFIDDAIGQ